jgi:hypothetical protein
VSVLTARTGKSQSTAMASKTTENGMLSDTKKIILSLPTGEWNLAYKHKTQLVKRPAENGISLSKNR